MTIFYRHRVEQMYFDDFILLTSAKSICFQEYHNNTSNGVVNRKEVASSTLL
jgi:hypothetical protein